MSEAKHTPGPWRYGLFELYEGADKRFNISQAEGAAYTPHYSDVAMTVAGEALAIQEANARLIAAAPELLEFVEEWLSRQGGDDNYMTAKARAAIAKATQ